MSDPKKDFICKKGHIIIEKKLYWRTFAINVAEISAPLNSIIRIQKRRKEMLIKKHLEMLGHEVKDKVSDFKGVVISMSFDLYGCIQADVRPKDLKKEEGIPKPGYWLDVSRLEVVSEKPLMDQPNFEWGKVAEGKKGPANLPTKF